MHCLKKNSYAIVPKDWSPPSHNHEKDVPETMVRLAEQFEQQVQAFMARLRSQSLPEERISIAQSSKRASHVYFSMYKIKRLLLN